MASRMVRMSQLNAPSATSLRRSHSMETYMVRVYLGALSQNTEFVAIEGLKNTRADEIVEAAVHKLRLGIPSHYELAETFSSGGQLCKERRLDVAENPVRIQLLWPRITPHMADIHRTEYQFYLRKKEPGVVRSTSWMEYSDNNRVDTFLSTFLQQPKNKEYPDLCNLPDLNETTLLENLKSRFENGIIYTYVGSILISVNPFKFYPIYNPKYVKMYQNRRLGDLPPHIFAIADAAYYTMLHEKRNQCIVISGESGSGKTESTNLLLHHLSALSQRGHYGTGVEQTILGAGPVLEAFGNAKTVHNNNSSRFGKFIQVNYKENGMVHGAIVEKYLLEKSRIVSQAANERNYHVFYYLLAGASEQERESLNLSQPQDFFYLNQSECYELEGIDGDTVDEGHEFIRLKQSMEMVGFSSETQRRIFSVLTAVLHLGNVEYKKKADHRHHEAVTIMNPNTINLISTLLKVKETTLIEALTKKKTAAGGETVVMNYNMADALATRDAMAKCLYGGLFDWIVLQVNHALLAKKDMRDHQGNYIGVLDIFGFEDFTKNSFEQFCINYANESLHYYFNQHIFKFEQEEYVREGIQWKNIEFIDNTLCLDLFAKKPTGLLFLLDEECNFPGATNETLLAKFHAQHQNHEYYEMPQMRESAFSIVHYAGKVKYCIQDFREKNSDFIRQDIMLVLKNSSLSFVRELVGYDPVAVLRWAIVRAFFRAYFAFIDAGKRHRKSAGNKFAAILRQQSPSQREAARMSMGGDMSGSRKVIIVEKTPARHASYHGDMHHFYDDDETDVDALSQVGMVTRNGELPTTPKSAMNGSPQNGFGSDGFIHRNKAMKRANRVMMKSKSFKPKTRSTKGLRDLKSMKTLAGKTVVGSRSSKGKNKPPSVSAQFNHSLSKLMDTLNQANPFFIRCIKSNTDKAPCRFNEDIVLQQLRYTGMLATVKIRQSGYNYRLTFEEFIQQYKILLPKGLVSSKGDVGTFLQELDLNTENYQIGITKVFLRETEKLLLDDALHRAIMARIVNIQRWMKATLDRRKFVRMKSACVVIQSKVRGFLAQRQLHRLRVNFYAALLIQKAFRGFKTRRMLKQQEDAARTIQKHVRGLLERQRFLVMKEEALRRREEERQQKELQRQAEELEKERLKKQQAEEAEIRLRKEQEAKRLAHLDNMEKERQKQIQVKMEEVKLEKERERWNVVEVDFSKDKQRRQTSEEEESKTDGRDGLDLHSSASDEGVLTKDSSTEDLIERGNVRPATNDNESESSGILDDSESEVISLGTSGRTTPPSTPQSPWVRGEAPMFPVAPQAGSTPLKVDEKQPKKVKDSGRPQAAPSPVVDDSEKIKRRSERFHTVGSSPVTRAQAGPKDLEVVIRPAIQKSASVDSAFHNEASASEVWVDKQIHAPLAKQESLNENMLEYSFVHGVVPPPPTSPVEEHVRAIKEGFDSQMDSGTTPAEDGDTTGHLSPFHRAKKHLKNFVSDGGTGKVKEAWGAETSQLKVHKKRRKGSKKRFIEEKVEQTNAATWSVSSTSQWQYPDKRVIQNAVELMQLDTFVSCKIAGLDKDNRRDTVFDKVFKRALREFYSTLITSQSVAHHEFSYKDLMCNYEETLKACARNENLDDSFPVTMGINAFRGFLDEFIKKKENKELPKIEVKKEKRKKDKEYKEQIVEHMKHKFLLTQFGIPTFCEMCGHVMWRGFVCQVCKSAVHKKCCSKFASNCKAVVGGAKPGHEKHVLGMPLPYILKDSQKVPTVVERLIKAIELNGLFTVGVYRKAGAAGKIKELLSLINTDQNGIDFNDYHVHVLTSVMKTFFRELPEPLLTYDLYDDFIRASECMDEKERVQALYDIVKKLPQPNYDLFERLVFHLANVAQHESLNKMSVNGIAIIFAPTVLKSSRNMPAQESLLHVPKQTICLESIIGEQLKKIRHSLADILTLDTAAASATDRLSVVRASMRNGTNRPRKAKESEEVPPAISESDDDEKIQTEERILSEHIRSLQQEKEQLTINMPNLECRHSSSEEDLLSTDDLDSVTDPEGVPYEEYAITFDLPAMTPPKNMRYLNKRRAHNPTRRLPSKRHIHMDLAGVASTTGVADVGGAIRRRLSVPELKQIGEAILV